MLCSRGTNTPMRCPVGALVDRADCPTCGFWGGRDELIDEFVDLEALSAQLHHRPQYARIVTVVDSVSSMELHVQVKVLVKRFSDHVSSTWFEFN